MTTPKPKQSKSSSLRESVLQQIATEQITPKQPWVFVAREVTIWTCAVVAVIIGALGFAAGLHSIAESDIGFYLQGPGPLLRFLSSSLPIIWIVVLLAMIFLTQFQIRHARNGYRYRFVVVLIVLATIILGLLFHLLHAGRFIERQLSHRLPGVAECFGPQHAPWERPEDGVLGGRILTVEEGGQVFIVRTPRHDDWTVDATGAEIKNKKNELTVIEPDDFIRMFGEKTAELEFRADKIRVDDQNDTQIPGLAPCGQPAPKNKPLPPRPRQ